MESSNISCWLALLDVTDARTEGFSELSHFQSYGLGLLRDTDNIYDGCVMTGRTMNFSVVQDAEAVVESGEWKWTP
jgi:hypothetical protein